LFSMRLAPAGETSRGQGAELLALRRLKCQSFDPKN
jgi:hypothetical protein